MYNQYLNTLGIKIEKESNNQKIVSQIQSVINKRKFDVSKKLTDLMRLVCTMYVHIFNLFNTIKTNSEEFLKHENLNFLDIFVRYNNCFSNDVNKILANKQLFQEMNTVYKPTIDNGASKNPNPFIDPAQLIQTSFTNQKLKWPSLTK